MSGDPRATTAETPQPEWLERVLQQTGSGTRRRTVKISLSADEMRVVREAARLRDISLGSFFRRAALAVAAHDLGVPFAVLTANEGRVARHGVNEQGRLYGGRGFGKWRIEEMK